ncbi:MAG: hypothetical protein ABII18_10405 [bacterium]|nr:hypothetical protein [bacterium]
MHNNPSKFIYLFFILLSLGLLSCGSGTTTSSSTSGNAFPTSFAIASPTASGSVDASINDGLNLSASVVPTDTFLSKASVFSTILAAASSSVCKITLPDLSDTITDPDCYGPALDYEDHPDGSPVDGQLPIGDLGIWTSTETGNEACTAAKINTLMAEAGISADFVMLLAASMRCVMKTSSTTVPLPSTVGSATDMTTDVNTAIQVNNPNTTVDLATITKETSITDGGTSYDVYSYAMTTTITDGADTITVESNVRHMDMSSTEYKGRIWAEMSGSGLGGDTEAFVINYHKESNTSMLAKFESAVYQSATASTVIFDSDDNLDVTGDWTNTYVQSIANLDPSNGIGDFSYAWQAGNGDDKARIFNAVTSATTGCGFFGYGDSFDVAGGTKSDNVIDGFICNWAGPNNDHSMTTTAGKAQKQCMTVNATTGIFEVDTSNENITYRPTVSCDSAG